MTTISIVTFISGDETFSDNFSKLCAMIANSGFLVDAIVYCDHALSNQYHNQCQCRYLNTLGYTKYARIQAAVRDARSDFLLFVDNDLQSDCAACLQFIRDCLAASKVAGGPLECAYGCLGFGTCERACEYDAMHVENGVAVVHAGAHTKVYDGSAGVPDRVMPP